MVLAKLWLRRHALYTAFFLMQSGANLDRSTKSWKEGQRNTGKKDWQRLAKKRVVSGGLDKRCCGFFEAMRILLSLLLLRLACVFCSSGLLPGTLFVWNVRKVILRLRLKNGGQNVQARRRRVRTQAACVMLEPRQVAVDEEEEGFRV